MEDNWVNDQNPTFAIWISKLSKYDWNFNKIVLIRKQTAAAFVSLWKEKRNVKESRYTRVEYEYFTCVKRNSGMSINLPSCVTYSQHPNLPPHSRSHSHSFSFVPLFCVPTLKNGINEFVIDDTKLVVRCLQCRNKEWNADQNVVVVLWIGLSISERYSFTNKFACGKKSEHVKVFICL